MREIYDVYIGNISHATIMLERSNDNIIYYMDNNYKTQDILFYIIDNGRIYIECNSLGVLVKFNIIPIEINYKRYCFYNKDINIKMI